MEKPEIRVDDLICCEDENFPTWTCEVTKISRPRTVYSLPGKHKYVHMTLVGGRMAFGVKTQELMYSDVVSAIHRGNLRNLSAEKRMQELIQGKMEIWKNLPTKN